MQQLSMKTIASPVGSIRLVATEGALVGVYLESQDPVLPEQTNSSAAHECLDLAALELGAYFNGDLNAFSVPLSMTGTVFQKSVWQALLDIPFGETRCYRDIAESIGRPKAVRAVGAANGMNRLSLLVPCHRVIGADGRLTGYAGGVENKEWLLGHERRTAENL